MALITSLPSVSTVASSDVFVKDTGSATQQISATNLATALGSGLGLLSNNPGVLYNSGKVSSGTITLSASYADYKFLLFLFQTNSEYCVEFVPTSVFSSTTKYLTKSTSAGNWVAADNSFQYESYCQINKTDNTHFAVASASNNVNYILGVVSVFGFK